MQDPRPFLDEFLFLFAISRGQTAAPNGNGGGLLQGVGQFMGQQSIPPFSSWGVLFRCKNYVLSNRVGQCVHFTGRLRHLLAGMDAHPAEIMPEARSKKARDAASSGFPGERNTSSTLGGATLSPLTSAWIGLVPKTSPFPPGCSVRHWGDSPLLE